MPEKATYLEIKALKTTQIIRNSFGICVTGVTPKPGPTSTEDTHCGGLILQLAGQLPT